MTSTSILVALSLAAAPPQLTRVLLNDTARTGAVCLDGSPGGWFERLAPRASPNATKYHIHLQGGGWGIGTEALIKRTKGRMGSSSYWPATIHDGGGMLSTDPALNPVTGGWNIIYLWYCDGGSFSGDADAPLDANGTKLWFRGRRILEQTLGALLAPRVGMGQATHVLLSGGSAGGLSAYLHANYVGSRLPRGAVLAVVPLSGFFLNGPNAAGAPMFEPRLRWVFKTHNATAAVAQSNPQCLADHAATNGSWKCFQAPTVLRYAAHPTFIVNSAYDSFQLPAILGSGPGPRFPSDPGSMIDLPGWEPCNAGIHANKSLSGCNATHMAAINAYHDRMTAVQATAHGLQQIEDATARRASGAFLHSCVNHVEGDQSAAWVGYGISGVVLRDAVAAWHAVVSAGVLPPPGWNATVHVGCRRAQGASPPLCNPTCNATGGP